MAESLVVSGLVSKRAELAGEVEHHRQQLQRLAAELGHGMFGVRVKTLLKKEFLL